MLDYAVLDERIAKCERILTENPKSQIFAALADALRKRGELDKAFRVCRQGLRLHPEYGAGHVVMARINYDRKMYDWAEKELVEAMRLDGRTRATDLLQAEILIRQEQHERAKVLIDALLRTDPDNEYYLELRKTLADQVKQAKRRRKEAEAHAAGSSAGPAPVAAESGSTLIPPREALTELVQFPGVSACFLTHTNGMMTESVLPQSFDRDAYAALSAEIYRFADENMSRSGYGVVKQVVIERSGEKIWMVRTGSLILVLVLTPNVNLGSLKLRLAAVMSRMTVA